VYGRGIGRALLVAVVLLLGPSTARAAETGYILPGAEAPIFTVAGGGTAAPKVGRSATAVRLNPREAVFLPDGRIVIRDARFSGGGQLVAVGPDGRIAALPPFPPRP
jgi:hypothetical protein